MHKRTRIFLISMFFGLYLFGVLGFYLLPAHVSRLYNQFTETDDGVNVCFDVFEPKNDASSSKKAVILGHGVMVNKEMLRLVAIDLASHGFVAVAFDFRGHGQSSGELAFTAEDEMPSLVYELRAMKAYLAKRGDIDMHSLGYLGYSLGGVPGFYELFRDNDFKAFVGMAAAPDYKHTNLTNPQNLLYIVGQYDEAVDFDSVYKVMENKTGIAADLIEINTLYGSFADGTAAKFYIDPYTDHMFAPYDSDFIREIRNWYILALNPSQAIDENLDFFWLQWVLIGIATVAGVCFFFFLSGPVLDHFSSSDKTLLNSQGKMEADLPGLLPLQKIAEDLAPKDLIRGYLKYCLLLSYPFIIFLLPLAVTALPMAIFLLGFLFGPSMATFYMIRKWLHQRQFSMRQVLKGQLFCLKWHQILFALGLGVIFYLMGASSIGNILGIVPGITKWWYFPLFFSIICFTMLNFILFFWILNESHRIRDHNRKNRVAIDFLRKLGLNAGLLIGMFVLLLLIPSVLMGNFFLMLIAIPTTPILFGCVLLVSLYYHKDHGRLLLGSIIVSILITLVVLTFSPYMLLFF